MPNWIDPLATLLAAFAGAWFAFLFEHRRRTKEQIEKQVGAANRAIYTIFNLWNIQEQVRKEVIEPYRGKPDAWLNMAATPPYQYGLHTFDAAELTFLLSANADLYASFLLEEQRFGLAMQLLESRSKLVLDEVFPKLARAGIAVGASTGLGAIEAALGADVVRTLRVISDGIVQNVDENLKSLVELYGKAQAALSRQFPDHTFIKIAFEK